MRMFAFCVSSSELRTGMRVVCSRSSMGSLSSAAAGVCGVWLRAASRACLGFQRGRNTDVRTFVSCQGGLYNKRRSIYRCSRLTPPLASAPPLAPSSPAALLRVLFALEATLVWGRAVNCNALRVPAREAEHWQLAASDTARQQRQTTLVKQLLTISTNKTAKMSLLPLPPLYPPSPRGYSLAGNLGNLSNCQNWMPKLFRVLTN